MAEEQQQEKVVREKVFKASLQTILKIIKSRKIPTAQLKETAELKVMTKEEREKLTTIVSSGTGKNFLADDLTYKPITINEMAETDTQKILTAEERSKIAKLNITGASDEFLAKDGLYKKVNADNISSGITNTVYTKSEKDKVLKLNIAGDGTKVLTDDGTYKSPASVNVINDTKIAEDLAYSNLKVETIISDLKSNMDSKLLQKSDINHTHSQLAQAHEHKNKDVLDDISLKQFSKWNKLVGIVDPEKSGLGTKVFCDDLTFKEVSEFNTGGDGSGNAKPVLFDAIDKEHLKILEQADISDPETISKILQLKYPLVPCTKEEYLSLQNSGKIEPSTVYIITNSEDSGSGGGSGSSIIVTSGSGDRFLADNGTYIKFIDDELETSIDKTYSIDKIIDVVGKLITSSTDTSVKIWTKQKLNVKHGDVFDALTTEPDILTKKPVIVQCYKFVPGEADVIEIIKEFDNTEEENFVYNKDSVEFEDTEGMKIIDHYKLNYKLNSDGLYESELIDKNEFITINRIEVI